MKAIFSMKGLNLLVLSLLLVNSVPSFAADYDVETVLQAYRDSFNWLDSATMKVQSANEALNRPVLTRDEAKKMRLEENSNYYWEQTREETDATFHSAGRDRWQYDGIHSTIDLHTGKVLVREDGRDTRRVQQLVSPELGFYAFQYSSPRYDWGSVQLRSLDDFSHNSRNMYHRELLPVLGYCMEYRDVRIPDLLTVDNVTLREEVANGKRYCILEAAVPDGEITLWLDPALGFAMHKSIAWRFYKQDRTLADKSLPPLPPLPYKAGHVTESTILKHEMMDGYSIPLEAEVVTYSKEGDITRYRSKRKIVLSHVQLNPDFEALQAFVLTVTEGTRIRFTYPTNPEDNTVMSFSGTWEDDKVVFNSDDVALVEGLNKAMAGATIQRLDLPSKLRAKLDRMRYNFAKKTFLSWYHFKNALVLDWTTLLLSLVAVGGCLFLAGRIIYRKGAASRDDETPAAA